MVLTMFKLNISLSPANILNSLTHNLIHGATLYFWGAIATIAYDMLTGDDDDAADQSMDAGAAATRQQTKISGEQWDHYKANFQPLEEELADEVSGEADTQGAADKVSNDVVQSFAKAREITKRNNARLGLNPASGAANETNRLNSLDMAKAKAFGMNNAREAEEQKHFSKKMAVTQLGKGLPGTAMNGLNASANQHNAQARMYGDAAAGTAKLISGLPWDKMGGSSDSSGGGSTYSGFSGSHEQGQSNFDNMNFDDISADSEHFADGGEVDGAGTGISDSIPAKLSDGEYVVPADVVQKKGTEFFDKLLDQHHTPAEMQARGLPTSQVA